MKKLLALFSLTICLFAVSNLNANPYYPPNSYPNQPGQYPQYSCVGRCDNVCMVDHPCQNCRNEGLYVSAFGGGNWINMDHKLRSHSVNGFNSKIKTDPGYAGSVAVGYKFNCGVRFEGEVGYRRNHFKAHSHFKDDNESKHPWDYQTSGHSNIWSGMANVLYDFDCVSYYVPNVVPYIGVGLGYAHSHGEAKSYHKDHEISKIKHTSHGIAGQAIGGIGYRLTDSTTIGLEYRYFVTRENAKDQSVGISLKQSF